jgi:hypothetical protein
MTAAHWDGICVRCGGVITQGNSNPAAGPISRPSNVVKYRNDWVHSTCVPGGEDE